jgi:hypothetical protein
VTGEETKVCRDCNEAKPLQSFYPNSRGTQGVGSYCRKCKAARGKAYFAQHGEKFKNLRRSGHLMTKYGLSVDDYVEMIDRQGGRCAICGTADPRGRGNRFHVDHDHRCCPGSVSCGNCVRGLLCFQCNRRVGDDRAWHLKAVEYLESHDAKATS